MQRRKFVAGLGSLAAGAAATIGTGAFNSAQINDRTFQATVRVDNNTNQLLRLATGNSPYATLDGDGKLLVDIDALAQDSEYEFSDLYRVQNNGQNNVDLSITITDNPGSAVGDVPAETSDGNSSSDLTSGSVRLNSGEYAMVGAEVTVGDGTGTFDGTFTIVAEEP